MQIIGPFVVIVNLYIALNFLVHGLLLFFYIKERENHDRGWINAGLCTSLYFSDSTTPIILDDDESAKNRIIT